MITIWSFVLLGIVLLPCGVLALAVWHTWVSTHTPEGHVEQEPHG